MKAVNTGDAVVGDANADDSLVREQGKKARQVGAGRVRRDLQAAGGPVADTPRLVRPDSGNAGMPSGRLPQIVPQRRVPARPIQAFSQWCRIPPLTRRRSRMPRMRTVKSASCDSLVSPVVGRVRDHVGDEIVQRGLPAWMVIQHGREQRAKREGVRAAGDEPGAVGGVLHRVVEQERLLPPGLGRGHPRLLRLGPSRCVSCTNPCTNLADDWNLPVSLPSALPSLRHLSAATHMHRRCTDGSNLPDGL